MDGFGALMTAPLQLWDALICTSQPVKATITRIFDNYMILIHAAIRGEGLALCGERFADDLIERGELVRPIDAALKSDFSFYLVHPANQPPRPNAQRFMDWLLAEAQGAPQS